jgi:hypothetical protein
MVFRKYTDCVQPSNFFELSFHDRRGRLFLVTLVVSSAIIAAGVLVIVNPGFYVILITVAIVAVVDFIVYLNWCLYGRLICLADEPICSIIGMVHSIEPPDPEGKGGDDDYSINVLLAPGPISDMENIDEYQKPPQGYLVAESPKLSGIRGYVQNGSSLLYMKALHCEFEGNGIRVLLDEFYVVLGILIFSLFFPAAAIIALFIALVALLTNIFLSEHVPNDVGTPLDIDASLGVLDAGYFVVLKGIWVYDSNHTGWNEIHPVEDCRIIATPGQAKEFKDLSFTDNTGAVLTLESPDNVKTYLEIQCGAIKRAEDAQNGGSRDKPEHDWGIHPSVDGCKPPDIIL